VTFVAWRALRDRYGAAMAQIEQRAVTVHDVEFAYLSAGVDGPLALCLHGFPDSAHTYRYLLPRLAAEGYRAIAPFQRGYAPTAVPADGRYQTGMLALDAIGLHEALGGDGDAVIIGHDWGASATYGAAAHAPERWRKVVTMAVPPSGAVGAAFLGNLQQIKRSWYMFFFQHGLADLVVGADDLAFIDMLWADWSPGHNAEEDVPHVKDALRDPANLAAALGYYRATLGSGFVDPALADVQAATQQDPTQPTLYLHGADDGCIGAEVAEWAAAHAPDNISVRIFEGCGHFLHVEHPQAINDEIMEFLS
jgi:pimeloyl-ACP methyl ester carboxylesterase